MAELPRISVITPSFNQAPFLEAALRSVLDQYYSNLEYLVLDGGSSDGSVEIIRRYESQLAYWHSRKDAGQADAIATGFSMATGEIFCWLNSDDLLLPGALQFAGEFFRDRPRIDFLYGNRIVIDEDGREIARHVWPWHLTRAHWALGQPLAQERCFWRRALYEKAGGIDRSRFFVMDYDLFFRMWQIGRFKKTTRYLGALRQHEATKNARSQDVRERELAEARERDGFRGPGELG